MSSHATGGKGGSANRSLDLVRGLAALLVVLGHARLFLFDGLNLPYAPGGLERILLAPTSFARESVGLFFVLSGFLVGGQVIREVRNDTFVWRVYLSKRLSRLWTVLIPGLLLTLLLDLFDGRMFGPVFADIVGPGSLDGGTAVCNIVFLQWPRCQPYGSNESLWSLAYEFWFYVLFAAATVAVVAIARRTWLRVGVGLAVAAGSILVFGVDLLRLLPAWLLGVVVAVVVGRWRAAGQPPRWFPRSGLLLVATSALFVASLLVSNLLGLHETVQFLLVGACCVPLIGYLALYAPGGQAPGLRRASIIGNWSYSSYVYHLPILKVLVAAVVTSLSLDGAAAIVAVYLLALGAYLATIPLWWLTERNTARVRDVFLRVSGAPARGVPVRRPIGRR